MTKASTAKALHNSTCFSVVLDFIDEIEYSSYLLKVVHVFLCLEDRCYLNWKEGSSADVIYYDIPLDLPGIEDNNNVLPQLSHEFIAVCARRQTSKLIPNFLLWVRVKVIEIHPAILEESHSVSVIKLSTRPDL